MRNIPLITGIAAVVLTTTLALAGPASYERSAWPHWIDADGDCLDTRQEVLIAESLTPPVIDGCRVTQGLWLCRYTGKLITDPSQLDVDHLVPLRHAWGAGGKGWSLELRRQFANDLEHPEVLIAVDSRANRQKGAKGPDEWRPAERGHWCRYAHDWLSVKQRYSLVLTAGEVWALIGMMRGCYGV